MDFPLRHKIGFMGLFSGAECAEKSLFSVARDSCTEFIFPCNDTEQSDTIVLAGSTLILQIRLASCFAKVHESVVVPNAINMVHIAARSRAGHVKPCETVFVLTNAVNNYLPIPELMERSSALPDLYTIAGSLPAREDASNRVVVQRISQNFGSQHTRILHHWSFK